MPRALHKRPRRVLSDDGRRVLNIWFIPHHTEVLVIFKTLDDASRCHRALQHQLSIAASLHDMLHYLCAHARLGSAGAGMCNGSSSISADWGGTEGIGTDLRDIQRQVDHLECSTDPKQVME